LHISHYETGIMKSWLMGMLTTWLSHLTAHITFILIPAPCLSSIY